MGTITAEFHTPWYYSQFQCKGGACRHTCCGGLAVNVSQEEYFRLLSLPCSAALRGDLDVALKPLRDADPYRYAGLMPTFFGECRLLDEKRLCRLQEECGLEALPAGCRYFPRSPRFTGRPQSCMANACEETLELLYHSDCSWHEVSEKLTFHLAGEIRQDNSPEAEQRLDLHSRVMEEIASEGDFLEQRLDRVEALLIREEKSAKKPAGGGDSAGAMAGFYRAHRNRILPEMLQGMGEAYPSMQSCCDVAGLRALQQRDSLADLERALQAVRAHFPRFDHFLTLSLANDLCYRFFPFADRGICLQESAVILRCEVDLLLYLCAANLNEVSTEEELIDLFAAFFRMTELTAFDRNCLTVLRKSAG